MSESRRLMGIDHGEARIGVALSDPLGLFATPHSTITCTTPEKDFEALAQIAREAEVGRVVVGLPTATDGGIGMQARIVIHWARALAEAIGLPVVLWDESYSSIDALAARRASGRRKRKGKRESLDDVAAAAILQDYLNAGETNDEPGQPLENFTHIA
jgi:putative Holliday junction resolvase